MVFHSCQAQVYSEDAEEPLQLSKTGWQYSCGNEYCPGHATIKIRPPVSHLHSANMNSEIVDLDIPFLLFFTF